MSPTIAILLYHSVSDTPTGRFGPYTVTRAQFGAHLDRLAEHDFTAIGVGDLLARRQAGRLPDRTAVITVDDGFADFADNAWPELGRRGIPATLYMTAGAIGGRSAWLAPLGADRLPMLSAAALRDLASDGCEIGAHSMSHPQLDCLPESAAAREIRESKDALEQTLSRPVDTFAYPHGYHDATVKRLVTDAGYTSAAAVRNVLSHAGDDPHALARVTVMSDFGPEHIDRVLTGRGVRRAGAREQLRTRAWRQVRRRRHQPTAVTAR